jgi:ribosome-associated heat shock protein Hsp15
METKLRLDKYLWAIRVFKTRTQAADAIEKGHVKLNGTNVKAAKQVSVGEQYEIKTEARKWIIQVTELLFVRKQYAEAVKYYADLTPEEMVTKKSESAFVEFTGKRHSKQGRPTKKNRRNMGNLL